jgi:hypothetical protein
VVGAGMTWQPIETAPRDGTMVLVYDPHEDGIWQVTTDFYANSKATRSYGWLGKPSHWMPLPPPPATTDAEAFLARILAAAQAGERVTAEDVARLRHLADWADAAPAPGWDGTLDKGEAARAVEAARKRMAGHE